jgi:hypothetical protein
MKMQSLSIYLVTLTMLCSLPAQIQSAPENQTGLEGVITVAPIHGGPIRPGVPSSRPLANTDFVVQNDKGIVSSFTTNSEGQFRILVPPGHYTVSLKQRRGGIGRYGPFDVDVTEGQMTKVTWQCDTGMR